MDVCESNLFHNRDWDPEYLKEIFCQDFDDFHYLWDSTVSDDQLATHMDRYCPVVEDISMDDETLCSAVEEIENK